MQDILNLIYSISGKFLIYLLNFEIYPHVNLLVIVLGGLFLIFFINIVFETRNADANRWRNKNN